MSGQISLSSPVEVKDSDAEIRLKEAHEGFVRTRMNIVLLNCNRWRNRIQRIQSADSVGPNSPFVGGSRSFNIEESPYVRIRQIIQSADSVGPNSPFVGGSRSSNIEESPIIHNYTPAPPSFFVGADEWIVVIEQEPTPNTSTSWSELAKLLLPLAGGALLNSPSTYSANALPPLYFYAIMVLLVVAVLALLSSFLHKTSPNTAKVQAMVGTAFVLATIPTLAAGLIPSDDFRLAVWVTCFVALVIILLVDHVAKKCAPRCATG